MLAGLRALFDTLASDPGQGAISADETRIAAAALLAHVVTIDGDMADVERDRVRSLLQARYSLGEEDARMIIRLAVAREREAVDMDEFTALLVRRLDVSARRELVAMMWDVARADGTVHEFEDNLIWRAAQLLGVPEAGRRPV